MADLTAQQIARLSPEKRQLLERFARERSRPTSGEAQLGPRSTQGPALLSFAQERLWLIDRLQPGNPLYNVFEAWRLVGALQIGALKRALNDLLERQDALRAGFLETEHGLFQTLAPGAFPIEEIDLTSLPASRRWAECNRRLKEAVQCPFDLVVPPLARACCTCTMMSTCC